MSGKRLGTSNSSLDRVTAGLSRDLTTTHLLGRKPMNSADVAIFGSGAAGSVIAWQLVSRGLKVARIEKGGREEPQTFPHNEFDTPGTSSGDSLRMVRILILAPIVRRKNESHKQNETDEIINGRRLPRGLCFRHPPNRRPRASRNWHRQ